MINIEKPEIIPLAETYSIVLLTTFISPPDESVIRAFALLTA